MDLKIKDIYCFLVSTRKYDRFKELYAPDRIVDYCNALGIKSGKGYSLPVGLRFRTCAKR